MRPYNSSKKVRRGKPYEDRRKKKKRGLLQDWTITVKANPNYIKVAYLCKLLKQLDDASQC